MSPSRRLFLKAAAGALAAPWLPTACRHSGDPASGTKDAAKPHPLGSLLGFGAGAGNVFFIGRTDLDVADRPTRSQRDIDFLGHGLAANPAHPHIAVVTQKWGNGAVEWDMRAGRVTRRLDIDPARQFYGHGAFTPDGKTLFLVESVVDDSSYNGVITVRDGDSYATRGEFPSYGLAPHDVLLIDDGRSLVITNNGGTADGDAPCVCYVDVQNRALQHKLTFHTPRINAGHLAMTSRGDLAIVSAPRRGIAKDSPESVGGISFYSPGGDVRTADDPIVQRMKNETLSVALHEPTMIVAATNPDGDLVTFWDFKTAKLVKHLDGYARPRGVRLTLDGRYFVLTYGQETHAVFIDAESLEPVAATTIDRTFISGSHDYIYDVPA